MYMIDSTAWPMALWATQTLLPVITESPEGELLLLQLLRACKLLLLQLVRTWPKQFN